MHNLQMPQPTIAMIAQPQDGTHNDAPSPDEVPAPDETPADVEMTDDCAQSEEDHTHSECAQEPSQAEDSNAESRNHSRATDDESSFSRAASTETTLRSPPGLVFDGSLTRTRKAKTKILITPRRRMMFSPETTISVPESERPHQRLRRIQPAWDAPTTLENHTTREVFGKDPFSFTEEWETLDLTAERPDAKNTSISCMAMFALQSNPGAGQHNTLQSHGQVAQ